MQSIEQHIEDLLERFFDGLTSNTEEKELYTYFSRTDIPEPLRVYKPVFGYFESGIIKEVAGDETRVAKQPGFLFRKRWWLAVACAAAALVFVVFKSVTTSQPFNPYEGSYIIRNGVRITDPDIIRPELEAAISFAQQQQKQMHELTCQAGQQEKEMNLAENLVTAKYNSILNSFPDKKIRKEVKNVLDIK